MNSTRDFGLLKTLEMVGGEATKKQLANEMVADYSSVIEMINRLVKKGIFSEKPDPADRRSRNVCLTAEGRKLSRSIDSKMMKFGDLVVGDLSDEEKHAIIAICKKLHAFHDHMYRTKNKETIKELCGL